MSSWHIVGQVYNLGRRKKKENKMENVEPPPLTLTRPAWGRGGGGWVEMRQEMDSLPDIAQGRGGGRRGSRVGGER